MQASVMLWMCIPPTKPAVCSPGAQPIPEIRIAGLAVAAGWKELCYWLLVGMLCCVYLHRCVNIGAGH